MINNSPKNWLEPNKITQIGMHELRSKTNTLRGTRVQRKLTRIRTTEELITLESPSISPRNSPIFNNNRQNIKSPCQSKVSRLQITCQDRPILRHILIFLRRVFGKVLSLSATPGGGGKDPKLSASTVRYWSSSCLKLLIYEFIVKTTKRGTIIFSANKAEAWTYHKMLFAQ